MKFPGSMGDKSAIKGQKSVSTQFGLSFARNALVECRPCLHRVARRRFSAEKAATKAEKTSALADCNAKFAGRRKTGGGYTYYDFLQDRTFDIAGPNPTPEEQKKIDESYTAYLANQRRSTVVAEAVARQQREQQAQQIQQVALRTDVERVPVPVERPKVQQAVGGDPRARPKGAPCTKGSFSCEWPRLSESLNDIKKLFSPTPSKPAKKS